MTEPLIPNDLSRAAGLVYAIDRRLARLAHDGSIGPHQPATGEEAALIGAVAAMAPGDWLFPGRQVNVAALWRGLPLDRLFAHYLAGVAHQDLAERRVVTVSHGPATRLSHAAGLAWAGRRDGVVALCDLGDGAVSDGDFHCGVNFAAVMRAPVVFVVRSDGTIPVAERAEGYGIPGHTVDGRDPMVVKAAVAQAAAQARNGDGPTLIEARVTRDEAPDEAQWSGFEEVVEAALTSAERALADTERAA